MSDAEQREPGTVESALLERLLRRTVGWPGLVATERPGRIRLKRRAEAGRRPLVEAVARRWAVARGDTWPGGRRFPLAVVRVLRSERVSTEPVAREPAADRPPAAAPGRAEAPRPSAVPPSPQPTLSSAVPPVVEARIEAADAPPPTATFAMPLLRRLGGPPAAPRMPLRAEARSEHLGPALARRTGPPTRRDSIVATSSTPEAAPAVATVPVAPSRAAPATTDRLPDAPSSATRVDEAPSSDRPPAASVDPATPPPSALPLQLPRVRARPAAAPVVLGAAPRLGPRPSVDTTVPAPTTAEILEWPVLLPFAVGGTRPSARSFPPGLVEQTVAPPRESVAPLDRSGGVPFPLAAPPSHAPWPSRALPLARAVVSDRRAVDARIDPAAAPPALSAGRMPDASPFPTDAPPPPTAHNPLAHVEPRPKKTKTSRLADEVYELIVRRLESERLRRGL